MGDFDVDFNYVEAVAQVLDLPIATALPPSPSTAPTRRVLDVLCTGSARLAGVRCLEVNLAARTVTAPELAELRTRVEHSFPTAELRIA